MTKIMHRAYRAIAEVEQTWSADKEQAHSRARQIVAQLVLCRFLTDGYWNGEIYCYKEAPPPIESAN